MNLIREFKDRIKSLERDLELVTNKALVIAEKLEGGLK
jgi:hypothetical protein